MPYLKYDDYKKEAMKNHEDALMYLMISVNHLIFYKNFDGLIETYNMIKEVHPYFEDPDDGSDAEIALEIEKTAEWLSAEETMEFLKDEYKKSIIANDQEDIDRALKRIGENNKTWSQEEIEKELD